MQSTFRYIVNVLWAAAMLILLLTTIVVTGDVAGRYLFNQPIPGVLELVSDFAMPLIVFLTAAHCYRSGGLINIDLILGRLTGHTQAAANLITRLISVMTVAVMAYSVGLRTVQTFQRGNTQVGVFEYKLWPTHSLIFLGILMLVVAMLVDLFASRSRNFELPRGSQEEVM
jgi:TRAP-type C4-dicarboxylate transport system permease small subunit